MSLVATHNKQPDEIKRYRLSYKNWLNLENSTAEELISSIDIAVTAVNATESPAALTTQLLRFLDGGKTVEYRVIGGTDDVYYDLEFTMTSTQEDVVQHKVRFRVKEL